MTDYKKLSEALQTIQDECLKIEIARNARFLW